MSGCEPRSAAPGAPAPGNAVSTLRNKPAADEPRVMRGREVYTRHCQTCHGVDGVGAPSWRKMDDDGTYPPPPLDGSGHAWHHTSAVLRDFILQGSKPGQGRMPAWRGRLADGEVADVIAWMQSRWPDELYVAWLRMEQADGK